MTVKKNSSKARMERAKILKIIFLLLLCTIALMSVVRAYSNAINSSKDFQWSPSVVFLDGKNPYEVFLSGDPENKFIESQAPQYAHGLYVLLAPIGLLDWESAKVFWAIFNIAAGAFIVIILCHQARLSAVPTLFVLAIFVCSTPFRNGVGNGQQNIITLLAYCAVFLPNMSLSSILCGFAYFKYSFAPGMATYLFVKRGMIALLISLVPAVVGFMIFVFHVQGDLLNVLVGPLKVNKKALGLGVGDVWSIVSFVIPTRQGFFYIMAAYFGPVFISIALSYLAIKRIKDRFCLFSFICAVSLLCFMHRGYDYVFLVPAFICAIANTKRSSSKVIFVSVFYYWFGLKMLSILLLYLNYEIPYLLLSIWNLSMLIATIFASFLLGIKYKGSGRVGQASRLNTS